MKSHITVWIHIQLNAIKTWSNTTWHSNMKWLKHFPNQILHSQKTFLNENIRISIKISLKFVPRVPINNMSHAHKVPINNIRIQLTICLTLISELWGVYDCENIWENWLHYNATNLQFIVMIISQKILMLMLNITACTNFYSLLNIDYCGISVAPEDHVLTHLPLVPHICVSELGQHWFR